MPWVRWDDHSDEHVKMHRTGDPVRALGCLVRLCCYCSRELTDGFVPASVAVEKCGASMVKKLCQNGSEEDSPSLSKVNGGYMVHDFLDYNPSKAQVIADRASTKGRVQSWRDRKRTSGTSNSVGNGVTNSDVTVAPVPVPQEHPPVLESKSYSRTRACLYEAVDERVMGYWCDKTGRDPHESDLYSLSILCKRFSPGVVLTAIGQAVAQGSAPDNFALITTIAKAESAA